MVTVGVVQRDAASAGFFDGTAVGELRVKRCRECGHWSPPPVLYCPACASGDLAWTASRGVGVVVSWSVVHPRRGLESTAATVIAIVELEEGPWVFGQLVGVLTDGVCTGQPVTVEFQTPDGGEAVPVYRLHPAGSPDAGGATSG